MRKLLLLFVGLFAVVIADAQNPATVFTIPQKHISLPCGTNCTNISVQVPHIRQSTTYTITNPAYVPYAYTSPAGTELTDVYDDDEFSARIPLPFAFFFCFYGTTYSSLSVGSNSVISFDPTIEQGDYNEWDITGPLPNTDLESAAIFGPMHDIDPVPGYNPDPTQRKIEWRVEGTAPKRRFIASYNSVAYYDSSECKQYKATHQMVIYENTGIIEVYIKDKPYCLAWNDGLTILGVQNADKTQAVTAAGKNATVWGTEAMDSCYRFIPYGGAPMFRRAELRRNNVVLATNTTDTSTASPGVLNLNFPNVCPTADSTAYEIKVYYGSCSNPALEVSFSDTVFIKKSVLAATFAKTDATCDVNGSITVTATGATGALQYSSNGGTSYQAGNTFTNLVPGTYTITVRDAGTCPVTLPVTINLIGSVTVNAGLDTTICKGATFTRTPISNGTTFTWTSTGSGTTAPAVNSSITISPQVSTTYTITAVRGLCSATDDFKVDVTTGAVANAGADGTILAGQSYQINATATGGTYTWTPPAGLSATNTLSPKASPAQTTTYTLQVTTPQGCTASDDVLITVVPYCIKPMIAFTPNGDGINDYWLITNGNCLTSAKAQVFNRYGAIVFESNDYKNDWQGTYKGKPLPDGTYYFVISFVLINGKTEYLKGNVTILR